MPPPSPPDPDSLGQKLLQWRTRHNLTQDEVGRMLRGVSGPTVGRWEKGQEIPGPVEICLECLLEGKIPFQDSLEKSLVRDAMWKLEMDLEAWEKLDGLRLAGGFLTVTDFIASLVQEELNQGRSPKSRAADLALLAEKPADYVVTAPTEAVKEPLKQAARAFLKKAAGAGGGSAGRRGGSEDTGLPAEGRQGIQGGSR